MPNKLILNKFNFQSAKILSSLSQKKQLLFLSYAERLRFKKNKQVFYENGIPTGVFILRNGRAKIYKTGIDGKEQIFYIYKAGELLGYHALLCDEPYEDACETLESCDIWFISKINFEKLLDEIPELHRLLIQNMSHEFGVLVNTITVLAQKTVRERLALYLLILNERYDMVNGKTQILLPREDLANIIGTVRENLGRLLKDFKESHLICINNKSIEILNFEEMARIARVEKL